MHAPDEIVLPKAKHIYKQLNPAIMRHKPMFLILLIGLLTSTSNLKAQTSSGNATVYWKFITEESMVDFFYRLVDCENKKQVYLRVKNDLGKERVISFTVEITGAEKIGKEISLDASPAAILEPACDDEDKNKMLKIELPPNFDVSSLEIKIKLHQ